MDTLIASAMCGRRLRWAVAFIAALTVLAAIAGVLALPRVAVVYELFWGKESLHSLFYDDVGASEAWSSFIASVGSFIYGMAWVPLIIWAWRLLAWKFSARQVAVAFVCFVVIYGHVPLVHALLGADACVNQRTGQPIKFYVVSSNGYITLFDSGGYDTASAVQKLPVTPSICASYTRQKTNARPHLIVADIHDIEFFDGNLGTPRVWYSRRADGSFEFFDAAGFNPRSGERLLPITEGLYREIMAQNATRQLATKPDMLPSIDNVAPSSRSLQPYSEIIPRDIPGGPQPLRREAPGNGRHGEEQERGPLVLSSAAQDFDVDCTGRTVLISGANGDFTLRGGCGALEVSGANVDVHAELLPGARITVSGVNADVYFVLMAPGKDPVVTVSGLNSHVRRVAAHSAL